MQKNWPQRELNAVLNQEAYSGEVKVLPLLVGTEQEKRQILNQFPLLNDKRHLSWAGDVKGIVEAMLSRLGRTASLDRKQTAGTSAVPRLGVPLPRIKKTFSQRDRDLFLRSGFTVVRQYFESALDDLRRKYQEVETDLSDVHRFKFVATIYVRGAVGSRCKIWLGGLSSSDSIAYSSGTLSVENDSSFNDLLSVADNEEELGFRPSGMWMTAKDYSVKDLLSPEQVAEYLWRRFTEPLA